MHPVPYNSFISIFDEANVLYLDLPLGQRHGWGVCGHYLSMELALQTSVSLLRTPQELSGIGALDAAFLYRHCMSPEALNQIKSIPGSTLDSPVLQASNYTFPSWSRQHWTPPIAKGSQTFSYMFFDETHFDPDYVDFMNNTYDCVIAGSKWCEGLLQQNGVRSTHAIIQGVDPTVFHPQANAKRLFPEKFVIFSGGKFELRKGQDLVVQAVKVLQQRYPDVLLLAAWSNPWLGSINTMATSKIIHFEPCTDPNANTMHIIAKALHQNGLDLKRTILLPAAPNGQMVQAYRNSDVGLFLNRWEGGTNLVLMEYMACGKPVIAANHSGHSDILTPQNALCINTHRERHIEFAAQRVSTWYEADLEETIAQLDWAYHHREELASFGQTAAQDMSQHSWQHVATRFLHIMAPDLVPATPTAC